MPQTVSVPDYVSRNAKLGLKYYEEGRAGDGLKDATVREARDMVEGSISEDKVRRMGPWFRRHQADLDAPKNRDRDDPGYPGAGLVAWLLWGGDSNGSMRAAEWAEAKAESLDREGAEASNLASGVICKMTIEEQLAKSVADAAALVSERDDLRKTIEKMNETISAELDSAKVELASKDSRIAELSAELEKLKAEASGLNEKVAEQERNAITASAEAAKIVASVGVAAVEQSPADEAKPTSAEDIRAKFLSMPAGLERTAFFNKHQKVIIGSKGR